MFGISFIHSSSHVFLCVFMCFPNEQPMLLLTNYNCYLGCCHTNVTQAVLVLQGLLDCGGAKFLLHPEGPWVMPQQNFMECLVETVVTRFILKTPEK